MKLAGRIVLVTGGSRGIGKAVVEALAKEGAKVAFVYKSNTQAAEQIVKDQELNQREVLAIQGDASKKADAEAAVKQVVDKWGRLDILVNNAGIIKDGLLATMEGIGAFVGAMLLALRLTPRWYGRAYLSGVICYLVTVVIFALAQSPALAGVALLLTGLGGAGFATAQATLVYLAAPAEMRSRTPGTLPPGSPATMIFSMAEARRSMRSSRAASASLRA